MHLFSRLLSSRRPGAPPRRPARWLALGDSYTIGEGVPESARWPVRAAALLRDLGVPLEPPRILARTGWSTEDLLAGMESARLWPAEAHFDVVSLLIGVNDQYRGRPLDAFATDYATCLARAVELSGGHPAHVLALSIPDWGVTPFAAGRDRAAIAHALDGWNVEARALAGREGVHWCDLTTLSRRHGGEPAFLAPDGLHPGPAAYEAWARTALGPMREALAGRAPARD